ncbi:uncharacterized protein LOC131220851 isoform X1 [Magnolia sinica]|uniref:uncharacterized protein LOC131220851 isoform X1 n=1 Tax=Magnolia sinica TaxID=86752 RepID=UPI002657FF8B|nr:uncharacterized protein LOC131220851 isoform X1 [Magnolia sinica]
MEMGVVGFAANKSTCVGMLNGCANMGSMFLFQATPRTSDVYEMVYAWGYILPFSNFVLVMGFSYFYFLVVEDCVWNASTVYFQVALLFKEHQNLLEEFVSFLPNATGVDLMQRALVERSLAMPMVQQVHGEEVIWFCMQSVSGNGTTAQMPTRLSATHPPLKVGAPKCGT